MKKIPKSVAFIPDVHLTSGGPMSRAWRVAKMFLKDVKPEMIIFGGDFLEMEALSAWDQDKRKLMEGRRYSTEIAVGNRELDDVQSGSPGSEYVFMEGNHEARARRYVEKNPEMEGAVLIHGNLDIATRGMEWVSENSMYRVGHMHFLHGWYWNKHHALRHVLDVGGNCMYGHVHKPQAYCHELRSMRRTHMAMSVGCLCDLNPAWLRNRPNSWQHGFGFVEFRPSGEFQATPINIVDGRISYAGETWRAK